MSVRNRQPGCRRGAVLLETALAVPLLGLIIGLIFFFGWGFTNQQRVRVAARYNSWKYIHTRDRDGGREINRTFFDDRASDVDQDFTIPAGEAQRTLEEMVSAAHAVSGSAGDLAEVLVLIQMHNWFGDEIDARFPSDVGVWQKFKLDKPLTDSHVREGVEWRRGQTKEDVPVTAPPPADVVRDQFLLGFDAVLHRVRAPGDALARMTQRLYTSGW